jgi:hypothetical protein
MNKNSLTFVSGVAKKKSNQCTFGNQGFKLKKIGINMSSLGAVHFATATNRKHFK